MKYLGGISMAKVPDQTKSIASARKNKLIPRLYPIKQLAIVPHLIAITIKQVHIFAESRRKIKKHQRE